MSPVEIVNAFIAAIEAKDIDGALTWVADEISYENVPIDPIVGRAGVGKTLEGFLAPASRVEWLVTRQWSFDRTVVNERLDRFEVGDGWLELPVAGIFEVDGDDKISLWRDYFDMETYTRQIAALTNR
jgi:limonene-1,2-epoxide hydrolase